MKTMVFNVMERDVEFMDIPDMPGAHLIHGKMDDCLAYCRKIRDGRISDKFNPETQKIQCIHWINPETDEVVIGFGTI